MPEIKNLRKTAERIKKAVRNKEKIILYGDSDLDGICSAVILKEVIEGLGGEISAVYFPDREKEGYGLSNSALNFLSHFSPALIFLLDCGISNFKEAKLAKRKGFKLIIIDHHVVLGDLPEAELIVDPKQEGDEYSFKEFATAGLVFKIAEQLLGKGPLEESLLELCALATISDRMSRTQENELFIKKGIESLEMTLRPGLQALLKTEFVKDALSDMEATSRVISLLGAGQPVDHLNETYLLLVSNSQRESSDLVKKLLIKREAHRKEVENIFEDISNRDLDKDSFILEGDSWPLFLLGTVASKISQEYDKPTFIFKKSKREISGSVRVPEGVDAVDALKTCSDFLERYGGHPLAAGFSMKEENLEDFRICLKKYFESKLG